MPSNCRRRSECSIQPDARGNQSMSITKQAGHLAFLQRHLRSPLSSSPLHGEILSFILGSLAVAIGHEVFHGSLDVAPALLYFGLLAVACWSMLYVRSMSTRVSRVLEESLISIDYIPEHFHPAKGFEPSGRIHNTLAELVSRAHCQILLFAAQWDSEQKSDS